jgi:hypothetical protein
MPTPTSRPTKPFGHRSEPAEAEAAGVLGVLDLGRDVLDDVVDLLVTEVAGEARHVGRTRADRLDDLEGRDVAQRRREGALASASPSPSIV